MGQARGGDGQRPLQVFELGTVEQHGIKPGLQPAPVHQTATVQSGVSSLGPDLPGGRCGEQFPHPLWWRAHRPQPGDDRPEGGAGQAGRFSTGLLQGQEHSHMRHRPGGTTTQRQDQVGCHSHGTCYRLNVRAPRRPVVGFRT